MKYIQLVVLLSLVAETNGNATTHFKTNNIIDPPLKRWYLGINGGPELSKVGSQTMARAGYHAGVLAGYRFHSRLSVETGVMLGQKNYFSKGRYFNASFMPQGWEVIALESLTTQVEIPILLKYDVHQWLKSVLFFSTGVVSYIFLYEENRYETMLNGMPGKSAGIYRTDYFSVFSEWQISGGYEHVMGKSGKIRIEPYKKFPLRKSGIGKMPVFSSGVNVALVVSVGRV